MRLFDSIVTFLKAATRSQPLILVLDNLHWADFSSLLLLEFAMQELGEARILTVCTYRDNEVSLDHLLSRTLGELTKEPHFQRLPLGGLTEGDVGTLIETVSGVVPSRTLIEQVHKRTEGNPLFVTEMIRLLSSEMGADAESNSDPSESQDGWNVKIPEGVREAIGTRLYRLSPETNRVLGIASVVGREFGLELLR
jgi:predicted ATPase